MLSEITAKDSEQLMLFSGSSNRALAQKVASGLGQRLGKMSVEKFSDGEVQVQIEDNVRLRNVYIIQSTCKPTNNHLMELMVIVDAMRRAAAAKITLVIPYFGYARQDRRPRSARVPITAKVVADMLSNVGADHVLTVDLHADQIQGFFGVPVDNIYASPLLLGDIWRKAYDNLMIVSPDVGGVVRARGISKMLGNLDLAIIDKRRPEANVSEVMNIIGEVSGRSCILVDDLGDTAGTLCKAADALKAKGAINVIAYCTHAVLSGNAVSNIENSSMDELVVTDSIPLRKKAISCNKIRQISISELLAETIRRMDSGESVSSLYME
jgi:ribose-phosphate pyrophosphokinase